MSRGLSAITLAAPAGVIYSPSPDVAARRSLVIPAMLERAPDIAQRRLLGLLTASELMAEIVAKDSGLNVLM